ncbi:MAG: hypothetical protein HY763_13200 [Planctomycetes bacterium]|nr:hypothetical protein [Planctomycetota bacterium]
MHWHHDEHDHSHAPDEPHAPGAPEHGEEPLDAANQSLADALRASFRILKGIMMILVVLYLFSNVRSVDSSEQALVVRLGSLRPGVHEAGLTWALPFPIDEIVPLPTRKSNDLMIDAHTFHREQNEFGKSLAFISRSETEGLNPTLDGALLTADAGLVHLQWKVTYKIDDVRSYVSHILGKKVEAAEKLLRTMVENVGIKVASELTAEEIIRTRVDHVQTEMKRRLNERLTELQSGIAVTLVEIHEPTPPLQIREAFDDTQRAENAKQARIREAEQKRTKSLNEAAGAAHQRLVKVLDELERRTRDGSADAELLAERDRLLEHEVEGKAGQLIKDAGAYLSVAVGNMQSDVELYRTLLPEYERNPHVLLTRLWEQTKQEIFQAPGVIKFYRPPGSQIRLHIPLDPEQKRHDEALRLQGQTFDVKRLRPTRLVPLGPEAEE